MAWPYGGAEQVWRDYNIDGDADSGAYEPEKLKIRALIGAIEDGIVLGNATDRPPTVNDDELDEYDYGSVWINTAPPDPPTTQENVLFVLLDPTAGAAKWGALGWQNEYESIVWGPGVGRSLTIGPGNILIGGANFGTQSTGAALVEDEGNIVIGRGAAWQMATGGSGAFAQNWNTIIGDNACGEATTMHAGAIYGRGAAFNMEDDLRPCAFGHGAAFYANGTEDCGFWGGNSGTGATPTGDPHPLAPSITVYPCIDDIGSDYLGSSSCKYSIDQRQYVQAIGYGAVVPKRDHVTSLGSPIHEAVVTAGRVFDCFDQIEVSDAAGVTYAAATFIKGGINRTTIVGAYADTMPTPANLLAAGPGIGSPTRCGYDLKIRNQGTGTLTLTNNGLGITSGGNTIAAGSHANFRVVFTNTGSAAPAYIAYRQSA